MHDDHVCDITTDPYREHEAGGNMTRIIVVDDHELVRAGLCRLLASVDHVQVVGQTGSGREAVIMTRDLDPDMVLLDFCLPDQDGLETTRQIVELGMKTKILILTMSESEEYATRLIRAGASGFLVKAASASDLVSAVDKVMHGAVVVSHSILEKMVSRMGQPEDATPEHVLSNRELQVLQLLARGFSTRHAAEHLLLSQSTVETYRSRILDKLDLRNNSDITRFAIRRGLIEVA
jgi:DNA-binding NarL/FixJ family response regulator